MGSGLWERRYVVLREGERVAVKLALAHAYERATGWYKRRPVLMVARENF
jgi:hypothetical protein